jgi:hypothetical protein
MGEADSSSSGEQLAQLADVSEFIWRDREIRDPLERLSLLIVEGSSHDKPILPHLTVEDREISVVEEQIVILVIRANWSV